MFICFCDLHNSVFLGQSRYSKEEKMEAEVFTPKVKIKPVEPSPNITIHVKNYSNENTNHSVSFTNHHESSKEITQNYSMETSVDGQPMVISSRSGKKRRRDKHRSRYSPEVSGSGKEHKRKRKKKSFDMENPNPHPRITIKVSFVNVITLKMEMN